MSSINSYFFKNRKNLISILFLIAIVTYVIWVNGVESNRISWAGDTVFPLDIDGYISKISNSWMNIGNGMPIQYNSYVVYYWIYGWILDLGVYSGIEVFYYLFLIATAVLSYFGFKLISFEYCNALVLSLIYTFNPLTLYVFEYTWIFSPFYILYTALPVIISSLLLILNENINNKKNYYFFAIGCLVASISYGNFPFAISAFLLVNIIAVSWFLLKRNRENFFKIITVNLVLFLCSLWAVVGQFHELVYLSGAGNPTPEFGSLIQWIQGQSLDFSRIFTLNPIIKLVHDSKVYIGINLIYALILFYPLIYIIKNYKSSCSDLIVLAIALAVFILLCNKGKGWLPAGIIEYLFSSNIVIGALRSYDKTIIILNSLVLTIIAILLNKRILNKRYLYLLLILSLGLSYPFFLGGIQTKYSVAATTSNGTYIPIVPEGLSDTTHYLNSNLGISDCFISAPFSAYNSTGWSTLKNIGLVGVDPLRFAVRSRYQELKKNSPEELLEDDFFVNSGCKFIVENLAAYVDSNSGYKSAFSSLEGIGAISLQKSYINYNVYKINNVENNFIMQCNGIGLSCKKPLYTYNQPDNITVSLDSDSGPILKIKNSYRPSWDYKIISLNPRDSISFISLSKDQSGLQIWDIENKDYTINNKNIIYIYYKNPISWKILFFITLVPMLFLGIFLLADKRKN
jgi:hypothetical protein